MNHIDLTWLSLGDTRLRGPAFGAIGGHGVAALAVGNAESGAEVKSMRLIPVSGLILVQTLDGVGFALHVSSVGPMRLAEPTEAPKRS